MSKIRHSVLISVGSFAVVLFLIASFSHQAKAATQDCSLRLTNAPSSATAVSGGEVTYSFTALNTGDKPCKNASISVYYGDNEAFARSSSKASAGTDYYWQFGDIPGRGGSSVSVTVKNTDGSEPSIHNEACLSADDAADSCTDVYTTIGGASSGGGSGTQSNPVPVTGSTSGRNQTPNPGTDATDSGPVVVPLQQLPPSNEYGIWFWDSPYALSWSKNKALIDAAAANGFKEIYVTIDDYLQVGDTPAYESAIAQFISYANQKGIAVDAESGWRDWAQTANRYKAFAIMDFVGTYNRTHPSAQFRNIQYDIEPYLLSTYESNKAPVLTDFVTLTDQLVDRNTSGTGLTMVIPHFYGSDDNWTPNITYKGKTASAFTLLLATLDRQAHNTLILMSYRDQANGSGGTLDISTSEMKEASSGTHSTKLVVAQETGNVDPDYVTFYGQSKAALAAQVTIIKNSFAASKAFGGIAIDYIDPFLQLK